MRELPEPAPRMTESGCAGRRRGAAAERHCVSDASRGCGDASPRRRIARCASHTARTSSASRNIPLAQRHREGAGQRDPGGPHVWVAGRPVPVDRRATSSRRRSFRRARTRSKSRCSTMRATARCICATWSSSARTVLRRHRRPHAVRETTRTGRSSCCRARTLRSPTIRR